MSDSTKPTDGTLDRGDRSAVLFVSLISLILACGAVVSGVQRLMAMFGGGYVSVTVPLDDEAVAIPIGPDGTFADATVTEGTITVPNGTLAPATQFALVAEVIVATLCMVALLGLLGWFCLNLARGRVFTRLNSWLFACASIVAGVWWGLGSLFGTMGVNGAFAAISDGTYDGASIRVDMELLAIPVLLAMIAAAFKVGEKLTRDTEGLV